MSSIKDSEMYKLGQFFSIETIDIELKEFSLKRSPDLLLSDEEIENIIVNNIWPTNLTYLINQSIDDYLEFVVPKYISTFSNSKIDGNIIIGVDDFGQITGIPTIGNLDLQKLTDKLKNKLFNYLKTDDDINNIMSNITIKLISLDKDINLLEDEIKEYYDLYKKSIIKFNNDRYDYLLIRKEWETKLLVYARKLTDIINTQKTRSELIEYIKDRNSKIEKCDITKIISLLEKNEYILIPSGEEIGVLKEDKKSFIYFLVKFKDEKVQEISKCKPKKPINPCFFGLSQMLSKISYFRYRFCLNSQIKYYLINIEIKGSKNKLSQYRLNTQSDWIFQYRVIDDNGYPKSL